MYHDADITNFVVKRVGLNHRAAWGWGRRYYRGNEANFMTDTEIIAGMGIAFTVVPWER